MTHDSTETIRRAQVATSNMENATRATLEHYHGLVWNTDEFSAQFDVLGFMAPYVVARDRATGAKGSLMFQHNPRFYFNWTVD